MCRALRPRFIKFTNFDLDTLTSDRTKEPELDKDGDSDSESELHFVQDNFHLDWGGLSDLTNLSVGYSHFIYSNLL